MLTEQETARIRRTAAKAGYCITLQTMKRYFQQHQRARETGAAHTQEKIEYHLTYLNFHYECGLLITGQYDKLQEVIKNWCRSKNSKERNMNMDRVLDMRDFVAAAEGDAEHVLGKFLYFSLANLLVDKEELSDLCDSMGIPYTSGNRLSVADAFRSATGDIRERVPVTVAGETNIYLAYCRDNKRTAEILSRELVKETMNRQTNQYEKLANISYDKVDGIFRCDNMVMDDAVDVRECCRKAEELFELYQRCANRKQIETICTNFLRGIEATKLSITGHMYFVPRTYMDRVDIFEDFISLLSGLNKKQTPLVVNSFYIIDDAKQRDKMTEEFYLAVKKEIATYQEKCDYLIKSGSQSPAIMERWVLKVQALEQKKRHYERVLQRELDGLDDEFSVLKFLSQELQVRANSIRNQRFPNKKAA